MNASHNSGFPQLVPSRIFCASRVIDVVPAINCCIHSEIRQQKSSSLTIPQLRALAFLQTNNCSSLTELAEYLVVTSASASTMVERLVQKKFITRTAAGEDHLQEVRQITGDRFDEKLKHLPTDQLKKLLDGLEELSQIFERL